MAITDSWIIAKYQNGCEFAGRYRFLDENGTWEDRQGIFRPLRTEEKRKREEFSHACIALDNKTNPSNSMEFFGSIYDAIAGGKIPGIRIE